MNQDLSTPIKKRKCEKCKKAIDISRFELHELQCKPKEPKPKEPKSKEPKAKPVQPRKPNPKKLEAARSEQGDNVELIPCYNCDYQMKLTELDSHPKVCVNREINCLYCSSKYPRNLMDNHKEVCTSRPARSQSTAYNSRLFGRDQEEDERSFNPREREAINRAPYVNTARADELPRRFGQTAIEAIRQAESHIGANTILQGVRHSRFLIQEIANRALTKPEAGLPSQCIRVIPEKKYEPAQQEECCSICCIQFKKGEKLKDLKCQHNFHTKCISQWLKINRVCPLCKTDLSVNVPNIQREEKVEKESVGARAAENYADSVSYFLRMLRSDAGFYSDSDDQ